MMNPKRMPSNILRSARLSRSASWKTSTATKVSVSKTCTSWHGYILTDPATSWVPLAEYRYFTMSSMDTPHPSTGDLPGKGIYSMYLKEQVRWRHAGKMGHMKEALEEMAHQPEREAAQERRKKKKEKNAVRKQKKQGKRGKGTTEEAGEALAATSSDKAGGLHDEEDSIDSDLELGLEENNFDDYEDEEAEPTLPDVEEVEGKMMAYVERYQESLKTIRGAEPTPEMFDDIQVNAYGSPTPLKAVGQVVIVSSTLAQITCFDPGVAKDVQKAIQLSLELNPQTEEGGTVKVPLPRVSMEVREQTAKQLKKKTEATKQRIRQVRRKAMDLIKKGKDGKLIGISKDDAFASGKEIDSATEKVMDRLQSTSDKKMESIMAV